MSKSERVVIYPISEGRVDIASTYYGKTGTVKGKDNYFVYVMLDDGALRAFGHDEIKILIEDN